MIYVYIVKEFPPWVNSNTCQLTYLSFFFPFWWEHFNFCFLSKFQLYNIIGPWTTLVWMSRSTYIMDYFSINMSYRTTQSGVGWILKCQTASMKIHKTVKVDWIIQDFWLCGRSVSLTSMLFKGQFYIHLCWKRKRFPIFA